MSCVLHGCERPAADGSYFCEMHGKFNSVIIAGQGLHVPTMEELEAIVPDPLVCPACDLEMFWRSDDRDSVVSVQHIADRVFRLVCFACRKKRNKRAQLHPCMLRKCQGCGQTQPLENFGTEIKDGLQHCMFVCRKCVNITQTDAQPDAGHPHL